MPNDAAIKAPTATLAATDLRKAMAQIERIVERRNTIPILSMVRIQIKRGTVHLSASDLDIWIDIDVEAKTSHGGTRMIEARTLASFARAAAGRVQIAFEGSITVLSDDAMTLRIKDRVPAEDFPIAAEKAVSALLAAPCIDLTPADLARLIDLSRHCISTKETRYYLNGLFLCTKPGGTTLRAVSTDGRRLAVIDSAVPSTGMPKDVIVPTKTVEAIRRALGRADGNEPVALRLIDSWIMVGAGDVTIRSKLIGGTYPDYTRALPGLDVKATVHLSAAMLARLAVAPVIRTKRGEKSRATCFDIASGTASVQFDDDVISVPLQGEIKGDEPFTFGFNLKYLLRQARVTPSFTLSGAGKGDPFTVSSDDPDAMWVIMPMRV